MLPNVIVCSFLIKKKNGFPLPMFSLDFFRLVIYFELVVLWAIQHLQFGHSPKAWRVLYCLHQIYLGNLIFSTC